MKKKQEALFSKMIMFFFIVVLAFGLIIINEKSKELKIKNINKKINQYITSNYSDIKSELVFGKTIFKNSSYYKKISNKENSNLYFVITYKDGKITSSYKKDYFEGSTLIKFIEGKLNNELIKKNTNEKYSNLKITLDLKLNNTTDIIKKRLMKNKYDVSLYTINDERNIILDSTNISKELSELSNYVNNMGFIPKYYCVTYNDFSDITNSIKIKVKSDILNIGGLNIGEEIINNNKSILNKYGIEIQYLN